MEAGLLFVTTVFHSSVSNSSAALDEQECLKKRRRGCDQVKETVVRSLDLDVVQLLDSDVVRSSVGHDSWSILDYPDFCFHWHTSSAVLVEVLAG